MIEGLMLTIPGEELRRLLQQRIVEHQRRTDCWKREQARAAEEQTDDEPLLPEHMCENEAERHNWRADVLAFIRERVDPSEVYRLDEADLAFGELLPEKPDWMEQQDFEERTGVSFHLGRLEKRLGEIHASVSRSVSEPSTPKMSEQA